MPQIKEEIGGEPKGEAIAPGFPNVGDEKMARGQTGGNEPQLRNVVEWLNAVERYIEAQEHIPQTEKEAFKRILWTYFDHDIYYTLRVCHVMVKKYNLDEKVVLPTTEEVSYWFDTGQVGWRR